MTKVVKNISLLGILILLNFGVPFSLPAQYQFFHPEGSFAIEISLENPPFDDMVRLPIYRNAISSLAVKGDYIVGGTTAKEGLSPFLFVASLSQKKLTHILDLNEVISGQRSIQSGFFRGRDDVLYAGTIANGENVGGHLIRIEIKSDGSIHGLDLGIPVEGEGIYALAGSEERGELYGITYPLGLFFTYDIQTGNTAVYDTIQPTEEDLHKYHEFAETPEFYLSRRLITDSEGRVYGSAPVNKLFYFVPEVREFHILKDPIPFVWGRHTLGRVDAWAKSKDGMLYGTNGGDGQLFKLNPGTGEVTNLGKPIMMNRIKGLEFGANGVLYGIAGGRPGYIHLFRYDPLRGFYDLGNPQFRMKAPGIDIWWRGFQLGAMAVSENGKYIVMGEDESLSQLMVFPVNDEAK